MTQRCVVFGANGFIGSALTRLLLAEGHEVVACDMVREFRALDAHPALRCRSLDFQDEVAVREVIAEGDWVFHLVSTTKPASSNLNMAFDVQSNVVPSIRLFQSCVDLGVRKVLFASSGGTIYGPPRQVPVSESHPPEPIVSYGLTKLVIERYGELFRRQFNLNVASLRIGNPYGPRHFDDQQGVIPVFVRRFRRRNPIEIWGDGHVVRDYVHVDDVARAFHAAARYEGSETVFNIGAGEGRSLRDIIQALERIAGYSVPVHFTPPREFDIPSLVLDISRAQRVLGWNPVIPFDDGLLRTWQSS